MSEITSLPSVDPTGPLGFPLGAGREAPFDDDVPRYGPRRDRDEQRVEPLGETMPVDQRLQQRPFEFDFFQAMRLLKRLHQTDGVVSLGDDRIARFAVRQSLHFPASSIQAIVPSDSDAPPLVVVNFMGLTGPSGVLPRHYTERLIAGEWTRKDRERRAPRDWLDLFHDRLIAAFHEAWEKYRFWIAYEEGRAEDKEPDDFTAAILSLIGHGQPGARRRLRVTAPPSSERSRDPEPPLAEIRDLSLLYYGGLMAQRPRSTAGLRTLLSDYFGLPVEIVPLQGQWLAMDETSRTRLGRKEGFSRLGRDAVVGGRTWDLNGKFRVRLGPLTYAQFRELFPDPTPTPERKTFFLVSQLTRLYAGAQWDFDIQLVLRAKEVPRLRLTSKAGRRPHLGWNTWLGARPPEHDADDAVIQAKEETVLGA